MQCFLRQQLLADNRVLVIELTEIQRCLACKTERVSGGRKLGITVGKKNSDGMTRDCTQGRRCDRRFLRHDEEWRSQDDCQRVQWFLRQLLIADNMVLVFEPTEQLQEVIVVCADVKIL